MVALALRSAGSDLSRVKFEGITGEVAPGERLGLTGPSGCGKTTLLRSIADAFSVGGSATTSFGAKSMDYLPQKDFLLPWYPCRATLAVLRNGDKYLSDQDKENAELLGVSDYLDRRPEAVSGGERQRIGLWITMCRDTQLVVADEPLTAVDRQRKLACLQAFSRCLDSRNRSLLVASHDVDVLCRLCDRVLVVTGQKSEAGLAKVREVNLNRASIADADFNTFSASLARQVQALS